MHKSVPTVRCAIYTRKSTEEGLDQDFNSLHAQREAAEAYIVSQKHSAGPWFPLIMMTAASPAQTSTARLSSSFWRTLMPTVWM
jgi:hypothetical protein